MIGSAYLKGGEIHLRLEWIVTGNVEAVSYPLGSPLMDFTWIAPEVSEGMFELLKKQYLSCFESKKDFDETVSILSPYIMTVLTKNPYLYFYVKAYVWFLMIGMIRPKEALENLKDFLATDSAFLDADTIEFSDIYMMAEWGKQVVLEGMGVRQHKLKSDLDGIAGEQECLAAFTPMQRLFLLQLSGKNYLNGEFKTTFTPDIAFPEDADMEAIESILLEHKADIVEMYDIDTLDDLIRFELFHTLRENLPVKKCKYCREYFIPQGRTDTEYCNRIKYGETKRCAQIGAVKHYQNKHTNNPSYAEFQKAYKRNHSRYRAGTMTQDEFIKWSEEAREKRDKCSAGKISLAKFKTWLGNR